MTSAGRRVAVTGLGVVSAVGGNGAAFWDSLVHARSGVRRLACREDVAGASIDFEAGAHFNRMQLTTLDRFAQLALVSAAEAVAQAGLEGSAWGGTRAGVYFGSGLGGAGTIETAYRAFLDPAQGRVGPMTVVLTMANAAAGHLSLRYGIRGPSLTYSVACASAAVAIGEAFKAVRDGTVDIAIAGGSEALLVPGILDGWVAMRVMAPPEAAHPERSCRPFSRNRAGLVLGEGAAAFVIEAADHARARGATPLAEIAGYGIASDASHLVKPDARGQAAAMEAAIADAGLDAGDIAYVNAHGTATPVGDMVETESIKATFGAHARKLAVSSTKALHGHLLGASGAVEFVATLMALRTGVLPPTAHLDEPDPQCDLDFVPGQAREVGPMRAAMSNSFAFGGTNAVLVARPASGL